MNTENDTQRWRYNLIGGLFAVLAILIVAQAIRIQIGPDADTFRELGISDEGEWRMVYPARGEIYDRWGHILAGNETVYEVGVELQYVENPETIALTLTGILHADYNDVFAAANQPASFDPKHPAIYAVLADNVTQQQKEQIQKLAAGMENQASPRDKKIKRPSLQGLVFVPHLKRSYPEKELASNILGFVNLEGQGYFGVEGKFNDLLAGVPQRVWVPLDPNRAAEIPRIPGGSSLVLTIDREIQANMEEVLDNAIKETGASGGTLAVMDPRNGEMLAIATTPRMDLNNYQEYPKIYTGSTPFDKAISQAYEPGSVYKILTMAAALDSGAVKPNTTFLDTGVFEIGGIYIYNWNSGAWGPQDMLGCLQHSLNVCLAWTASKMGPGKFYSYMQAFGIGHLTGIDLAGENPGRLKMPGDEDWYDADLGTNAFGQGVSATPVQMLMAISSVANDGKMVAPHVLRSLIDKGRQYNTPVQVVGMPISAKTAHTLTNMLATSLETEGSDAIVAGYRIAGKTGTAQIPTPSGYTSDVTNASFVGWGPVDDPRFIVYVWLEKPTTSIWGSVVAAPVFKQAVERLVVLMNLPPDDVRHQMAKK